MGLASRLSRTLLQASTFYRSCSDVTFVKRNVNLDYAVFSANATNIEHPPIIVGHGVLGNKKEWEAICMQLNSVTGRKVISYDAVNHGYSQHHSNMSYHDMAIDLVELLEKLNISKTVSFVGHRMGGKIAMILALIQPERVEKIVVIDTVPCVRQHNVMGENTVQVLQQLANLKLEAFKSREEAVNQIEEMNIYPMLLNTMLVNLTETVDGRLKWMLNLDALVNQYNEILSFPQFHEDVSYNGASLFLTGNESHLSCANDRPSITKRFPNADVRFMAEHGDYNFNMHRSKPQAVLSHLQEFLEK